MIAFTPEAARQVADLHRFYEERERLDALRHLAAALTKAMAEIEANPSAGLAAPRPYSFLAKQGRAWIKAGRYWIAYSLTRPPVIMGVYFETADIPRRS